MNKYKNLKSLILCLCLGALYTPNTLYAQDKQCIKGSLSEQFCDENNDMMADPPKDKSKWLNPYTLVFGNTPNQSFIFYDEQRKEFIKHLEKVTGKKVVFFQYQTNSAELEAMRSGLLHIAGLNTGSVPTAINCAGFNLFAMTAKKNNIYGYKMLIITYPNSGIKKVSDIKGKTILFTSSSSNSGHKAPVALLKQKYNMIDGIDYKSRFSGKHSKSILKIANHEYKMATIANGIRDGMINKGKIAKNDTKIIYQSKSYPTTGYGYSNKLNPNLAKKIEEAFLSFKARVPFNKYGEDHFMGADYKNKWKIIRDINSVNNITYNCR